MCVLSFKNNNIASIAIKNRMHECKEVLGCCFCCYSNWFVLVSECMWNEFGTEFICVFWGVYTGCIWYGLSMCILRCVHGMHLVRALILCAFWGVYMECIWYGLYLLCILRCVMECIWYGLYLCILRCVHVMHLVRALSAVYFEVCNGMHLVRALSVHFEVCTRNAFGTGFNSMCILRCVHGMHLVRALSAVYFEVCNGMHLVRALSVHFEVCTRNAFGTGFICCVFWGV